MTKPTVPADPDFADPRFIERIRSRDKDAIRSVVHAYLPHILRAAGGAGLTPERAEDVAQETFKTFIESAERFEGRSHVRTWLFGIMYRKIHENRRREQKFDQVDDIHDVMESRFDERGMWSRPPRTADRDTIDAEIRQHIAECMDEVPQQQRMAFVLREVEGFRSDEICNSLEVSRTNLGVLLFRARNRLRECLERKGQN